MSNKSHISIHNMYDNMSESNAKPKLLIKNLPSKRRVAPGPTANIKAEEVESSVAEFSSVEVETQSNATIKTQPEKLIQVKPQKPKSILTRFFQRIVRPGSQEIDETTMADYRQKVAEIQLLEKERRLFKRKRRAKKRAHHMELIQRSRPMSRTRSPNTVHVTGSDGVIRSVENIIKSGSALSIVSPNRSSPLLSRYSSTSVAHTRRSVHHKVGPISMFTGVRDLEEMRRLKEYKRRKISQLYVGDDVYHHSFSKWDHENSKFYARLDEQKRKKYPITENIQKKMNQIRDSKFKKEQKREIGCVKWLKKQFFQTTMGRVFLDTPRYYKMTPVLPKNCIRCKYPLEDTLEPRWTPIGITFAILFPIVGILCCLANREFVCVVCEEIYVYGDYPSRCKPMNKEADYDGGFKIRKTSFLNSYQNLVHKD